MPPHFVGAAFAFSNMAVKRSQDQRAARASVISLIMDIGSTKSVLDH